MTDPIRRLDLLIAALAVAAAVLLADRVRFVDPDVFMNFLCARDVLALGRVPTVDTHSFARPAMAWTVNEWLGQLVQLGTYRAAGGAGLLLLRAGQAAAAAALLIAAARRSGATWLAAAVALLVCWPAVAHFFLIRVRTLSFVLLPALLALLVEQRRGARWAVWLLPPLFALWVNLHGAYFLGLAVVGMAWIDAWVRRLREGTRSTARPGALGIALLASAAATSAHPAAGEVHALVVGTMTGGNIATISEWLPVWRHPLSATWSYTLLLPVALAVAVREAWRGRWMWTLLLAGLALQTALHVRFGVLLGLALVVPLARWLQRALDAAGTRGALPARAVALACALAVIGSWPLWGARDLALRMDPWWTPVAAVRFMQANHLGGDVLAEYDWGAFVVWELPEARVFIDSRSDLLYPEAVEREWSTLATWDSGWERVLDDSDATALLLRAARGAPERLAGDDRWVFVYADEYATLQLRICERNRAFLERLSRGEVTTLPPTTDGDLVL